MGNARPCRHRNKLMVVVKMLVILVEVHLNYVHVAHSTDQQEQLERAALLTFMAGITLDPGGVLSNWNSTMHVCNWAGVQCNSTGRFVVELDLSVKSLSGTISPLLSNLTSLAVLDLSENFLDGTIPRELGRLSRLRQLNLWSNHLEGHIPAELGNLGRLVYLSIRGNLLSGNLPEPLLCNCTSLQYVDLSNNSLTGAIGLGNHCRLTHLRYLLLWSNAFVGSFPSALSNSTRIRWIDLESNLLTGELPAAGIVDKMPYLQSLHLSYNNMSSHNGNTNLDPFFTSLCSCQWLEELEIAGNGLGGMIPSIVGNLSLNLLQLHLEENRIHGPIHPKISNLLNLTYLNLSNNLLNGSIPPDIGKLKKLERIFLNNNLLSEEIPSTLGEIPHLGLLDISGNRLSGPIPDTISKLSQLRRLLLHRNNLSGPIPPSLENCNNLEVLDLSNNRLRGDIPTEVAGLRSLTLYMNLSRNFLQGPLPLQLSKLDMVITLDLSSNNFTGMIPSQLSSCIALEYLNLSGNGLSGPLSNSIGELPYIEVVDVSSNKLSGIIPESFHASKTLKRLNLSFNDFVGFVSSDGVFASLDMKSFMGNTGLCGEVFGMQCCSSKRGHRLIAVILAPLILTLIGVPLFMYLTCGRLLPTRSRMVTSFFRHDHNQKEQESGPDYPRISYRQLVIATGGLCDSNLIGTGSFGRVYKGVLRDGTRIAVKVLDVRVSGGEAAAGSFKRECEVLKRTRHRNLIRIITTCTRPDFKALVLPLMENGSLENHLYPPSHAEIGPNERYLSLTQIVRIASDVAEGMTYLHHYAPVRVVHCDLKPSNVLLDRDMTAVLSDFGTARLTRSSNEAAMETATVCNSMTNLLCGSVGYIAPEYGTGGHPTPKGDVYSFGIVLLEMITGKRPTDVLFREGSTLQEWVKGHYPHNLEPLLPEPLSRLYSPFSRACISTAKVWRDVVVELIELGLECTQLSPSLRPTMVDVAHMIAHLKDDLTKVVVAAHTDESSSFPSYSSF